MRIQISCIFLGLLLVFAESTLAIGKPKLVRHDQDSSLCWKALSALREEYFRAPDPTDKEFVAYAWLIDHAETLAAMEDDHARLEDVTQQVRDEISRLLHRGDVNFSYFFNNRIGGWEGFEALASSYGRRGRLLIVLRDFAFISRHVEDNLAVLEEHAPKFLSQFMLRPVAEDQLWSLLYLSRYVYKNSTRGALTSQRIRSSTPSNQLSIAYDSSLIGFESQSKTRQLMVLPPALKALYGAHRIYLLPSVSREMTDSILAIPVDAPLVLPAFENLDSDRRLRTHRLARIIERKLQRSEKLKTNPERRESIAWKLAEAFVSEMDMFVTEDRLMFEALSEIGWPDDIKQKQYEGVPFRQFRLKLSRGSQIKVILYHRDYNAELRDKVDPKDE